MKIRQMAKLMGQVVNIKAQYVRFSSQVGLTSRNYKEAITWKRITEETPDYPAGWQARALGKSGWITGFRWVNEGTKQWTGDGVGLFETTKRIPCVLVSLLPTSKPVHVPLDGFTLGGDPMLSDMGWSEKERETASHHARCEMDDFGGDFPRDARGRYIKRGSPPAREE